MSTNDPTTLHALATDVAAPIIHLRFDGNSRDIALDALAINSTATDSDVRNAVARFLDVALARLDDVVIERHANGNLTLRPEAVFG